MKTLRSDPLHWSWASNATRVRQKRRRFRCQRSQGGSDVVYENSIRLASLLKHVPGLVYQGHAGLSSDPQRHQLLTVRKISMWSRVVTEQLEARAKKSAVSSSIAVVGRGHPT